MFTDLCVIYSHMFHVSFIITFCITRKHTLKYYVVRPFLVVHLLHT